MASDEILSSDEADTSEDEDDNNLEDLEDMGRSLETLLSNKKSSTQILREREEKERKNLQTFMLEGHSQDGKKTDAKKDTIHARFLTV